MVFWGSGGACHDPTPVDARTLNRLGDFARERAARGFTFDDLAEAIVGSDWDADTLAAWLSRGRASGFLADLGSETLSDGTVIGPQRFCLAEFAPHGGRICRHGAPETDEEPRYWEGDAAPVRYR